MQQWIYHSDTAQLYAGNGILFGHCYSGNRAGLNNPAMESVHNVGPIPAGYYRVGTFFDDLEPNPPDGLEHKGPHVCYLITVAADGCTQIAPPYDREGLMVHGDNKKANFSASKGCLIAARFIRDAMQAGDILQVVHD